MHVDKVVVNEIICEMLESPGKDGRYPTSICYNKIEKYIDDVRKEVTAKIIRKNINKDTDIYGV